MADSSMSRKRKKARQIFNDLCFDIPLPLRRQTGEARPVRPGQQLSKDQAMDAVKQVYPERLKANIYGFLKELAQKEKPLEDTHWEEKYEENTSLTRVPRDLLTLAETRNGYLPKAVSRSLKKHGAEVVQGWNSYARDNFQL